MRCKDKFSTQNIAMAEPLTQFIFSCNEYDSGTYYERFGFWYGFVIEIVLSGRLNMCFSLLQSNEFPYHTGLLGFGTIYVEPVTEWPQYCVTKQVLNCTFLLKYIFTTFSRNLEDILNCQIVVTDR